MCKQVPKYINEICSNCHPQAYVKSFSKFTGKVEEVAIIVDGDTKEFTNEYLYACVKCGATVWVDEQWVQDNTVEDLVVESQMQVVTIQQRNEYIHNKMLQLDQVNDAYKHTHRLGRIMKYHKLLTNVEVAYMRQRLHRVFRDTSLKGCEDK